MADNLESTLTRVLARAAEAAPVQPPGLLHDVDSRFRQRQRRTYAVVAGVAVFAVLGGSVVATRLITGGDGAPPQPGTSVTSAPTAPPAPPARPARRAPVPQLWPKAYHTLPKKLSNGRAYHPVALAGSELLVTTDASFENADAVWAVDLNTGATRQVAKLPTPKPHTELFASHFTIGGGQVVWWSGYNRGGTQVTEIWKVPLSGGTPALVTTVEGGPLGTIGATGDRLTVVDQTVYWSPAAFNPAGPAVWQAPLSGGQPSKVPGSDGYALVAGAWIGSPAFTQQDTSGDTKTKVVYQTLRNLVTGEVRTAQPGRPGELWVCAPSWCLTGNDKGLVARHPDGSGRRALPGQASTGVADALLLDRFAVITPSPAGPNQALFDLRTGDLGDIQIRSKPGEGFMTAGAGSPDDAYLAWDTDAGKKYAILDLTAID
jgi:hypothetical protein